MNKNKQKTKIVELKKKSLIAFRFSFFWHFFKIFDRYFLHIQKIMQCNLNKLSLHGWEIVKSLIFWDFPTI